MNFDTSDLAAIVGAVMLGAGLLWVHPGWLVALIGAGVLLRTASRTS